MTDTVKKIAPEIWSQLQSSRNVLLHCHPNPDGDSIGGALAMAHLLKGMQKKVTIIAGDSTKPLDFSMLPGYQEIIQLQFNELDLSIFDTFVIQDSSKKDQISSKSNVEFPETLNTIVIDHHKTNLGFGKINLIDATYPATCQIIFDLMDCWNISLTPEIAICLFVGIYTDTGGFKYPPTDKSTLAAAAKLAEIYPTFYKEIFILENSRSEEQIKFRGLALSNIKVYFFGRVAISAVSFTQLEKEHVSKESTEKSGVSSELIAASHWQIGISCIEVSPGETHLSMRTRNAEKFDVSKLANELGGGGHAAAAGARIKKNVPDTLEIVTETIKKLYPDLATS